MIEKEKTNVLIDKGIALANDLTASALQHANTEDQWNQLFVLKVAAVELLANQLFNNEIAKRQTAEEGLESIATNLMALVVNYRKEHIKNELENGKTGSGKANPNLQIVPQQREDHESGKESGEEKA